MRPHPKNDNPMRTTMTAISRHQLARGAVRAATMLSLAVIGLAATACNLDKTLKVQDIDNATPGSLNDASALPVLYAGGLSDFAVSVNGTDASITMPGLLTDELRDIDTFPTRIEVDQRKITVTAADALQANNGTIQAWYRSMHQARASLKRAIDGFKQFGATDKRNAELHALLGLDYIMFGEDYCNGVAYSDFVDGVAKYGGPNTTTQTFQLALSAADSALQIAAANSNEAYLAQIVRARALLNLNQKAQAATAVAGVPVTFHYWVYNSENSNRENNGVYINVGPVSKRFAVAERDAPNSLAFRTMGWDDATAAGDPRIRWYKSGIGQDGQSVAYYTSKYPNRSTSIEIAGGVEAKLIIAENLLATGNVQAWLDTLNALRANTALLSAPPYTLSGQKTPTALAPLTDPGAQPAREDLMFQERAFWLYLTGHRLGDLRRMIRFYGRTASSVFPSGTYLGAAGGQIGTDVNFPVPIDEQNNTSAPKCTDRSP
jgi:hypothetical protein